MEILGNHRFCCYSRRCNDYTEQDIRLHQRRTGCTTGQCDGCRYRTAAPWLLYGIGAILAIVLTFFKIPALAFALGMFIPLELNVPLVVGGAVNWYVTSRSKDTALNTERGEKGTLLASGFIAGGALMGVVSAAMRFGGINLVNEAWLNNTWSEVLALGAYALLILYFIKASMKVK